MISHFPPGVLCAFDADTHVDRDATIMFDIEWTPPGAVRRPAVYRDFDLALIEQRARPRELTRVEMSVRTVMESDWASFQPLAEAAVMEIVRLRQAGEIDRANKKQYDLQNLCRTWWEDLDPAPPKLVDPENYFYEAVECFSEFDCCHYGGCDKYIEINWRAKVDDSAPYGSNWVQERIYWNWPDDRLIELAETLERYVNPAQHIFSRPVVDWLAELRATIHPRGPLAPYVARADVQVELLFPLTREQPDLNFTLRAYMLWHKAKLPMPPEIAEEWQINLIQDLADGVYELILHDQIPLPLEPPPLKHEPGYGSDPDPFLTGFADLALAGLPSRAAPRQRFETYAQRRAWCTTFLYLFQERVLPPAEGRALHEFLATVFEMTIAPGDHLGRIESLPIVGSIDRTSPSFVRVDKAYLDFLEEQLDPANRADRKMMSEAIEVARPWLDMVRDVEGIALGLRSYDP